MSVCVCVVYIGVKEQNDEKSRKVEQSPSYTQHTHLTDYELPLVINFISL